MKRRWLILVLATLGLLVAVVNAQFSQDFSEEFLNNPNGRAFLQTYGALKSGYLNDVDDEKVIQGAIEGMLRALDDPYTAYVTPRQAAFQQQRLAGSYGGIGATLSPRDRQNQTTVEIISIFRNSPAWNAGLQRGDIFVELDGEDVRDRTLQEIVDHVRGPKGTPVDVGVRRAGTEDVITFTIVRDDIELIDVEATVLPNDVGYVAIRAFANQRVHEQLRTELAQLKAAGVTSLILDLRDNGGGLLNQGVLVADEFLSSGDIVFQRARGVTQRYAQADQHSIDLPMVVLVNRHSASASEIVAGALQENGRALVVGEETFGKGVGQSVLPLTNGGQLTLLSFEWLTPNRNSINEQGITPDVLVEDSRLPNLLEMTGRGAPQGEEIQIVVGGEVIATATADENGEFSFFQPFERAPMSDLQGEAIVDLETDQALQVALDTLLNTVIAGATR